MYACVLRMYVNTLTIIGACGVQRLNLRHSQLLPHLILGELGVSD